MVIQEQATAEGSQELKKLVSGKVEPVLYHRAVAGFLGIYQCAEDFPFLVCFGTKNWSFSPENISW